MSENPHITRRSFLQATALGVGAGLAVKLGLSEIGTDTINKWRDESHKYVPVEYHPGEHIQLIEKSGENRLPHSDDVYTVPHTGTVYTREYSEGKPLNTYKILGTAGLLTQPKNYDDPKNWDVLKGDANNPTLEGPELMFIWNENARELSSTTLDNAQSNAIRVLPDIKYALLSNREVIDQQGNRVTEKYIDPQKVNYILEKYAGTVIGFTIDEPHRDAEFEGARMDWESIVADYKKLCGLPINIIEFGILDAADEGIFFDKHKELHDYTRKLQLLLSTKTEGQPIDDRVQLFGGSFNYPVIYDLKSNTTVDSIIATQTQAWEAEYRRDTSTPSWLALAAHDTGERDTLKDFENIKNFGDHIPLLTDKELAGDTKAHLFQMIAAIATNPTYSRISWWNWPFNGDNAPYSKSMSGIRESLRLLKSARNVMNGKTIYHESNPWVSYTIKQTPDNGVDKPYEAVYIHVKQNGKMPYINLLNANSTYIDTITGLTFKTNWLGQLSSHYTVPKNTVFSLVPALLKK